MRQALKLHPDRFAPQRHTSKLMSGVRAPQLGHRLCRDRQKSAICTCRPQRRLRVPDELWQHTCFEAFIGTSSGAGYYEFNFAPSTQWADIGSAATVTGMPCCDRISART